MADLLSIIVLSYKNGDMLFETLDSILSQDYQNIEIIICDDASPEFDTSKIERYFHNKAGKNITNYIIIVNSQNVGTVKNINIGIKASNGVFIKAIAGDDMLAAPSVCTRQIQYLREKKDIEVVTGNTIECDGNMNPISYSGFLFDNDEEPIFSDKNILLKYVTRINQKALATQAMCFRKSFFFQHGFYDEDFLLVEDLPMAIRMVDSGKQIGYINTPCVMHRGQVGVSTSNKAFDIHKLRYYRDLEKYYVKSLIPLENKIGRSYVRMRHGLIRFRIAYCELENPSMMKKIMLCIRFFPYLMYYIATQTDRVGFYIKGLFRH